MNKRTPMSCPESTVTWESLEDWARLKIQGWFQELLEQEVAELLGREHRERRRPVDGEKGYRNGYGKPRRLSMQGGTITCRRPRVRGLEERFESRLLPLFARRTKEVGEMLPELYLHGLSQGDFELALRGLLGEGAPLSASSIARLRGKWQVEYEAWRTRRLDDRELVYAWADGVYVKAGLEREKAALLVVIGAMSDGRKEVLAVEAGYRESTESWAAVLRDLRDRGLEAPKLLVADGNLGIWAALAQVYPETRWAVLEPSDRQRRRSTAEETATAGERTRLPDPLCPDPHGGGAATEHVCPSLPAHPSEGGGDPREGLGGDGRFL